MSRPARAAALFVTLPFLVGLAAVGRADDPGTTPSDAPRWVVGRTLGVFQDAGDAIATRVGLWLDGSYVDNDRQPGSVDLNHVNVLLDTRWRQQWQLFLEMEYEHEVDRGGGEDGEAFEIEQVFLRFAPFDALSLRLGRFNTPAGIWLPVHWSILQDTIQKPPHAAKELLPEQQVGLELAGRWFPGYLGDLDVQVDYSLYVGAGGNAIDQDDVEGVSFGADLRLLLAERYLVGASAYWQKNDDEGDRSEQNFMLYAEAKLPANLLFRTEYLHQRRGQSNGRPFDRNLDVVYAKLRWDALPWLYTNYRVSFGDEDGEDGGPTAEQLVNTLTLGIRPHPIALVKLEYSSHEFSGGGREDFNFWGVSLGLRF